MSYDDPEYWDACDEHESTYPKGDACTACLQAEIAELRGNLSLAEEGLANYQQENAQLREALLRLSVSAQRLSEEAALALARVSEPQSEPHT